MAFFYSVSAAAAWRQPPRQTASHVLWERLGLQSERVRLGLQKSVNADQTAGVNIGEEEHGRHGFSHQKLRHRRLQNDVPEDEKAQFYSIMCGCIAVLLGACCWFIRRDQRRLKAAKEARREERRQAKKMQKMQNSVSPAPPPGQGPPQGYGPPPGYVPQPGQAPLFRPTGQPLPVPGNGSGTMDVLSVQSIQSISSQDSSMSAEKSSRSA
eukprot:CAMPEP_0119473646 /NCGR_PEP_ID=MMETSP1344-20130328/5220_1 /TAXON_ID=236787 /ORGANISM="Florenciella parvula, Strain CCMP2471" /LENGTH=210 /DNA_ID=CAMNT_0007506797 /DNA_START=204 /DNA_END=836 /DNA_ORIENTATION=+